MPGLSKRIYLHIGWNKTGTKTIQHGLVRNADILSKNGALYPLSGRINVSHHNIAFQLLKDHRFTLDKGSIDDLKLEIEDSEMGKIIISSEFLITLNTQQIESIFRSFAPLGIIKIIVYIRRQDLWLISHWSQLVKSGKSVEDFNTFIERRLKYQPYLTKLNQWGEVFGRENICVRVLEKTQMRGNLFHDFLRSCDIQNVNGFEIPRSIHKSPTLKELEIIRYIYKELGINYYPGLIPGGFLLDVVRSFGINHGWDLDERLSLVSEDLYNRIEKRYRESNHVIAREFLQRDQLFLEPFKKTPLVDFKVSMLPQDEALDLLAHSIECLLNYFAEKDFGHDSNFKELSQLQNENNRLRREIYSMKESRGWKLLEKYRRIRGLIFK